MTIGDTEWYEKSQCKDGTIARFRVWKRIVCVCDMNIYDRIKRRENNDDAYVCMLVNAIIID